MISSTCAAADAGVGAEALPGLQQRAPVCRLARHSVQLLCDATNVSSQIELPEGQYRASYT